MRVGVVISTIGKSPVLGDALASVRDQTAPPVQVVVVDQSDTNEVRDTAERIQATGLPVTRLTSPRGVSLGRNLGRRELGDDIDVIVFQDDDCMYPHDFFERLVETFNESGADVISAALLSNGKHRIAFKDSRTEVTRANVWTQTIENTTIYRKTALDKAGFFDETLGIGCPTKWQSGEGTDLLLRVLDNGGRIIFEPSLVVTEHQPEIADDDYLHKVRKYGRGTGRVYRLRYSLKDQVLVILKPLAGVVLYLVKGKPGEAAKKWHAALGRIEGMTGPAPS